jgi:hypothetical protein
VIQVIVVAECGSELSLIWTISDGIPNLDLKVSGELSAIVHAAAGTQLVCTPRCRARGRLSDRTVTSRDVCILHQMIGMVRRVGLRRVARRGARIRQSMSMPKVFSLRYSDERAIPRVAAACTRLPPASRNARRIASRSIDSSALSVLPEIWQQ